MQLLGITLQRFRSFQDKTVLFQSPVTVITAPNASGKTTILEAVYLLSWGESFRAENVAEMITLGEEIGRVKGKVATSKEADAAASPEGVVSSEATVSPEGAVEKQNMEKESAQESKKSVGDTTTLEVMLTHGIYQGKKVQSRLFLVNDVKRLRKNFIGSFQAVLFRPEDLRLIDGSPERRRQFVDSVLSKTDATYAGSISTYHNALIRRNRALEKVRDEHVPRSTLNYWTQLILEHGQYIQQKRREFFGSFAQVVFPEVYQVDYLPSVLNEARLAPYSDREIAAGHTLIGPHKDDFVVKFGIKEQPSSSTSSPLSPTSFPPRLWRGESSDATNFVSVATYGSRGQERLAVLWLKMCELSWVEHHRQEKAVLLLDDILSELDEDHRRHVYSLFPGRQVVATTTEERFQEEICNSTVIKQETIGQVSI